MAPTVLERVAVLEESNKNADALLVEMRQELQGIKKDVSAIRQWMDSSGGKLQGAIAITGLVGLGSLLHYAAMIFLGRN